MIEAKNQGNKTGEIYIYGDIVSDKYFDSDVTPAEIKKEIDKVKNAKHIDIYVNSMGGGVYAGQAIYSQLKRLKAEKFAYVDGIAASIASLIVMAADKVFIPSNGTIMVHNPWTIYMGYASDFRKAADELDRLSGMLVEVYAEKTGMKADEIKALLDAEKHMSGAEAVALGFADELIAEKKVAASLNENFLEINGQRFDVSQFKNFDREKIVEYKPEQTPDEPQKEAVNYDNYLTVIASNKLQINKFHSQED